MFEVGLELHPEKTKIVYCKDDDRRREYSCTTFDFLATLLEQEDQRISGESSLSISHPQSARKQRKRYGINQDDGSGPNAATLSWRI